jgi:hypothetical protein
MTTLSGLLVSAVTLFGLFLIAPFLDEPPLPPYTPPGANYIDAPSRYG